MEEIELSEIPVHPRDKILYNEVLCDKVNSKLKKLQVRIKQTSAADGSRVYNLDIRGIRHKFHLQLNFTPQDLCFVRFDEFQENMKEPSCFNCLNRNFYHRIVYSRLLFLLYSDSGGDDEAKCIKIPLLQRGNINAATSLRKLHSVIQNYIAREVELKHWPVHVISCDGVDPEEPVFLCITRHALVIILQYHILHYHATYSSHFTVQTSPDRQEIEIIVTEKSQPTDASNTMALSRQYMFKTPDWRIIESTLKSIQRQSLLNPPRPRAHFNIIHSEMSASGFVPGTTSDNVAIMPHYRFDNNNSSSGTIDYLHPLSNKPLNASTLSDGPTPHITPWASSSNGHIPANSKSPPNSHEETFMRHSEIIRPSNIPLLPEDLVTGPNNGPYPHRLGAYGQDSDPNPPDLKPSLQKSPSCGGLNVLDNFGFERGPGDLNIDYITENDEEDLPPPQPCSTLPHPHGELFAYKPPPAVPEYHGTVHPYPRLPRWQSLTSLTDIEMMEHLYVNVEQSFSRRTSVHDDSPYFRFYYNCGFVRVLARMSKKIKRRQRLSKEIQQIDFNKLENHELWFDQGFKMRDKDLRFCRLSKLNIQAEDSSGYSNVNGYSRTNTEDSIPDDPYWNSSLCLTIQSMLQENPADSRLSDEIQQEFDLTHEQLAAIQVLLSLVPSEKNWKYLAEYIGLDGQDVSIIEHYCYTYRELAAKVVLFHWLQLWRQQKVERESNWDSLHTFLEEIDRQDIKNVMNSRTDNVQVQKQDDLIQSWSSIKNVEVIERNDSRVDRQSLEENDEMEEEEFITHF